MRIWDIEPRRLCRNHLLGEHRELHAIWAILTQGKKGYSSHPETLRWRGKLRALYLRHERLVKEFARRNYKHKSKLQKKYATGGSRQRQYLDSYNKQLNILKRKGCGCKI